MAYSIGPNQKIVEESFEQIDDVKSWDGGSTDFSFSDEDRSLSKEDVEGVKIPKADEL